MRIAQFLILCLLAVPAYAADVVATIEHPTTYENGAPLPAADIATTRAFWSLNGTDWNSGGETIGAATEWTIRLPDFKCGRVYVALRTVVVTHRESVLSDPVFADVSCKPGKPRVVRIIVR